MYVWSTSPAAAREQRRKAKQSALPACCWCNEVAVGKAHKRRKKTEAKNGDLLQQKH